VLTVGPDVRCIAFHYWAWARQRNISFRDCIGSDRRFLCRERRLLKPDPSSIYQTKCPHQAKSSGCGH
jgi:hypothetical protein